MSVGGLHALSATELAAGYAAKRFSPVEVCEAVLAQVARHEPQLQALYLLRPDAALEAARASEARWHRGAPQSPLDGVPATLKDNLATAGDPLPIGCAGSDMAPAAADAPPAARLREAGCVLFAKTTMPDIGMLTSGLSSFHATAKNPWDTALTPGGSSAGAGAAAAGGYGPLHIGTDIGGSIRLPAGWCGIAGFKPSLGRIPIDPPTMGRVAGPMARTVGDIALAMQALARPDARDTMALPPADIAWHTVHNATPTDLRGLRIGLWLEPGCGLPVDAEVAAAVQQAARAFEAAGATVEPLAPWFTRTMLDGMDHFWRARALADLGAWPAERQARVLPYIREWAASAATFDGQHVYAAYAQFHATRVATVRATQPYDLVISPVCPVLPPPADDASATNDPLRPLEHIAFTVPFNMSEQPAIALNAAYTQAGLPIGLQIAGCRFDDLGVLRAARAYEQLRGPQRAWPLD